ncbi:MAG: hypothetical protein AAFR71_02970 [Pseudomonadota bacterium]
MSIATRLTRTILIFAVLILALPLALILAVVAFVLGVAYMAFAMISGLFKNKPRWDDAFSMHTYEAEAVRVDRNKLNKRPIVIDHE